MPRFRVSLNGEWDFSPLVKTELPASVPDNLSWQKLHVPSSWRWSLQPDAEYQPFDLFGYPSEWNQAEAGWIRRMIRVEHQPGARVWLHFAAVLQRSVFFLNGKQVYASTESFLPVEFDITDHAEDGLNELAVWCGPYEKIQTPQGEKVLAPCGSWFAALARGPWQDVWMEIVPAVSISDLAVRTSLREGWIEAEVTLENRTLANVVGELNLCVRNEVGEVLRFETTPVQLNLGVMTTIRLRKDWKDARLWEPDDPYLYTLEAAFSGVETIPDRRELRFGFREVWIEEKKFILNGKRINLRGDAWHYQGFAMQTKAYALNWYRMCKDAGVNFVRLHAMPYPEFFLDAADESGMLIVDESAIYGSGKAMQADHPTFLKNCHDHLRALVRRDRSHPSVIIWSMQNEMRWVDGRDGYRDAMPELTRTIKSLDPTRPVSYDGDNRLFPPEKSEIVSMHYNIDGTVASWDRTRPLIFGERGAFHYVSPQVAARFGGSLAYINFDEAMRALAWSERLFIQYARREEVTGLTPFNLVNYTLRALPSQLEPIKDQALNAPGVHLRQLPAYCLTVNNGLWPDALVYVPTQAWRELATAFQPAAVVPEELDTHFFSGEILKRTLSLYNDTRHAQEVTLSWRWTLGEAPAGSRQTGVSGPTLDAGTVDFRQMPGERKSWRLDLHLPLVSKKTGLTLSLELCHAGQVVGSSRLQYWISPAEIIPLETGKSVLFLGNERDFTWIRKFLPEAQRFESLESGVLDKTDVVVVGADYPARFEHLAPLLEPFVRSGGVLLILEQTRFIPPALNRVERTFPLMFIGDSQHPAFRGLSDADLRFWGGDNPWAPGARGLTRGAFERPSGGNLRILLEAGDGDFGWGGLLWSPLVEFCLDRGKVICCQVALREWSPTIPPARLLLRNLLAYACDMARLPVEIETRYSPALLMGSDSAYRDFLARLGADQRVAAHPGGVVVTAPEDLSQERIDVLRTFMSAGGQVLVMPAQPEHGQVLTDLAGTDVRLEEAPVYQLVAGEHELARGIAAHDLYFLERVTYTPAIRENRIAARYAIQVQTGNRLFENPHNPWKAYFVDGLDGEYQKIAIATRIIRQPFMPRAYGVVLPVGAGRLVLSQLLPEAGAEKTARVYARLLGNLGAVLESDLFRKVRPASDFSIGALMALPREAYHDPRAMEAYFSDPNYTLNNLGEGVYGWMKRAERVNGVIHIPGSAGRAWFLSVFVQSQINRDPERRAAGELPDSSIVPDLYLESNRACRVYLNGDKILEAAGRSEPYQIQDAVLRQGVNRLVLSLDEGEQDVRLNLYFLNKYGDPVEGLSYPLTLD